MLSLNETPPSVIAVPPSVDPMVGVIDVTVTGEK